MSSVQPLDHPGIVRGPWPRSLHEWTPRSKTGQESSSARELETVGEQGASDRAQRRSRSPAQDGRCARTQRASPTATANPTNADHVRPAGQRPSGPVRRSRPPAGAQRQVDEPGRRTESAGIGGQAKRTRRLVTRSCSAERSPGSVQVSPSELRSARRRNRMQYGSGGEARHRADSAAAGANPITHPAVRPDRGSVCPTPAAARRAPSTGQQRAQAGADPTP